MTIIWPVLLVQIVIFALILLFFFSFYRFINGIVHRSKSTNETLRRLEEKIDALMEQQKSREE